VLKTLPSESVHCVVTSPPYWGLRDYGVGGQLGLEETPQEYVDHMVEVFREVWRVLREDGVCWLNLGDSYAGSGKGRNSNGTHQEGGKQGTNRGTIEGTLYKTVANNGLKPKDLVGIPWRVAFALQADGWWLRSDIIWHKPNCMPESVTDRPTKAHEYVFLLTKSARYFYDAEAIREPICDASLQRINQSTFDRQTGGEKDYGKTGVNMNRSMRQTLENFAESAKNGQGRNKRTVWTIPTAAYSGAHFATFPTALIEPMIAAGTSQWGCCRKCGAPFERVVERTFDGEYNDKEATAQRLRCEGVITGGTEKVTLGRTEHVKQKTTGWQPTCTCPPADPIPCTVLDPFSGAGTTALQADRMGRDAIIIDLNAKYAEMSRERIASDAPMFADVEVIKC